MPTSGGNNKLIKDVLIAIFSELDEKINYQIKIPEELTGGYISENVFYEMDMADLVIADITGRSPNVFYEIAMLQSMGKPMIFIDSLEEKKEIIPFYLNHTNIHSVGKMTFEELKTVLKVSISRFFDHTQLTNYSTSVISQYYGLPLVYISAVMGVAFGYYSNFLKPFLKRNTGAIAQPENNVSHLYIIKPIDLSSEDTPKKNLSLILKNSEAKQYNCPESTRGKIFCPFVKEENAYDVPSALFTLKKSPRLKKLKKSLSENQNVSSEIKVIAQEKLEIQVIEQFFSYLEFLIQEEAEDLNDTYSFVKLDDI